MSITQGSMVGILLLGVASSVSALPTIDFESGSTLPSYVQNELGVGDFSFTNIRAFATSPLDFTNTQGGNFALETTRTIDGATNDFLTTLTLPSPTSTFSFDYSAGSGFLVSAWDSAGMNLGFKHFGATFATGSKFIDWNTVAAGPPMSLPSANRFEFSGNISYITFRNDQSNDFTRGALVDNFKFDYPIQSNVPEPSTYVLMLVGLLGIGFATRRRMH